MALIMDSVRPLEGHSICVKLLGVVIILILVHHVDCAPSSADIGVCEIYKDGGFDFVDCMSGPKGFCCLDKAILVDGLPFKWSKRCCSEAEFVDENWYLFMSLLLLTIVMAHLVIVAILTSFSSIILTQSAVLE